MRVYFINLDRETDRRAHMEQALAGIDHERVPAVDGCGNPPTEKGLTRFEIACLNSHRAAWRLFLETPASHACFLEDDVHFADDFRQYVGDEDWIPADAHAVKLDSYFNKVMLGAPRLQVGERSLARLFTRHESCAAYVLSRAGAEYFLRATESPELPVDYIVFPEDPVKQGLMLYQLAPAAAIQDQLYLRHHAQGHNFTSAISRLDARKPAQTTKRLFFVIRRETLRLYRQIFQARRYAVNRVVRALRPEIVAFRQGAASEFGSGSRESFRWRKHYFLPRLVLARSSARGMQRIDIVPAEELATIFCAAAAVAPYARTAPRIANEPPGLDDWRKALAEGPAQPPRGDVALLRNASIVAGGVIIADDGRVVAESLHNTGDWARFGCFFHPAPGAPPQIYARRWIIQNRLSGPVHVMLKQTFDRNYGHWLVEGLPRVVAALKHCDPAQCRVIVSKKGGGMRHVYAESLAAFGVRPEQIVRHRSRMTHVDQIIYPLPISRHPFLKSPEAIEILESIPKRLGLSKNGPKRLYVLRGRGKRRLVNEQALLDILLPLGFETVDPGALSFGAQVQKFSGAEIIVGNCGAALTNAVFAPRGVVVFALTTQTMRDDFFWDLTDLKRGRYFSLHGKARDESAGMYSDFEIDPDAFRAMLAESLAATTATA